MSASHDVDLREIPLYGIAEAARILRMPTATLRTWVDGRHFKEGGFSPPLFELPEGSRELSFNNLIEGHVLRALRKQHLVRMAAVREALAYASEQFGLGRLLLSRELQTAAGQLFIERFGELINLSKSGQLGMKEALASHLQRVHYDEAGFADSLYPITQEAHLEGPQVIVIDPRLSFGHAVTRKHGITTDTLAARFDAGDSILALARDYGLKVSEVEEAIRYERARYPVAA